MISITSTKSALQLGSDILNGCSAAKFQWHRVEILNSDGTTVSQPCRSGFYLFVGHQEKEYSEDRLEGLPSSPTSPIVTKPQDWLSPVNSSGMHGNSRFLEIPLEMHISSKRTRKVAWSSLFPNVRFHTWVRIGSGTKWIGRGVMLGSGPSRTASASASGIGLSARMNETNLFRFSCTVPSTKRQFLLNCAVKSGFRRI